MYIEDPAFRHQLLDSSRHIVRQFGLPLTIADDVYQSVLTTLSQFSQEKLQRIDDLKAYTYKMLRHEAIRTFRQNSRRQITLDEIPDTSDGSASAEGIQATILLKDLWTRLNDEERELLRMLFFGYDARLIASRLKISHAAARQKTFRLRKKLRELIFEVPKTT